MEGFLSLPPGPPCGEMGGQTFSTLINYLVLFPLLALVACPLLSPQVHEATGAFYLGLRQQ